MNHINNITGREIKIVEMSDDHIVSTIKLILNRLERFSNQESYDSYIQTEEDLELLSNYMIIAHAKGLWNLPQTLKLENIVDKYERKNRTFFKKTEQMSTMQEHDLL